MKRSQFDRTKRTFDKIDIAIAGLRPLLIELYDVLDEATPQGARADGTLSPLELEAIRLVTRHHGEFIAAVRELPISIRPSGR